MPELPEVETVCRGLNQILHSEESNSILKKVELRRKDLRYPMPKKIKQLKNVKILRITRRAKYILFETSSGILVNHLGMTGSWRQGDGQKLIPHDHVVFHFAKTCLIYNDPRRFGVLDFVAVDKIGSCRWFKHLGVEPLEKEFTGEYLKQISKNRKIAIKNFIMDQKVVVGVGNIYASEALFMAGILPQKSCARVSLEKYNLLADCIKKVLRKAIRAGGTTIRDFKQTGGSSGYFQQKLLVYGREGQNCRQCHEPIFCKVIGGRSSYFCKTCQP